MTRNTVVRWRFEGQVRKRVVECLESPSGIHGETDGREGEHQPLSEEVQHMHGDGWRENRGGGIRSEVWEGTNRHVEFAKSKFPSTGNFRLVPSQQIPQHPSTPAPQEPSKNPQRNSTTDDRVGVKRPPQRHSDRMVLLM